MVRADWFSCPFHDSIKFFCAFERFIKKDLRQAIDLDPQKSIISKLLNKTTYQLLSNSCAFTES
jgi:hypothetical protein